jgi:hypothetical protein
MHFSYEKRQATGTLNQPSRADSESEPVQVLASSAMSITTILNLLQIKFRYTVVRLITTSWNDHVQASIASLQQNRSRGQWRAGTWGGAWGTRSGRGARAWMVGLRVQDCSLIELCPSRGLGQGPDSDRDSDRRTRTEAACAILRTAATLRAGLQRSPCGRPIQRRSGVRVNRTLPSCARAAPPSAREGREKGIPGPGCRARMPWISVPGTVSRARKSEARHNHHRSGQGRRMDAVHVHVSRARDAVHDTEREGARRARPHAARLPPLRAQGRGPAPPCPAPPGPPRPAPPRPGIAT